MPNLIESEIIIFENSQDEFHSMLNSGAAFAVQFSRGLINLFWGDGVQTKQNDPCFVPEP